MRLRYQRTFVRFLPFEADQNGESSRFIITLKSTRILCLRNTNH
jgi:hypothetical protein